MKKKQVRKDISIQNKDSMKNIHLSLSEVATGSFVLGKCTIKGHMF